ncbi:uncharacterized protein LODBEIA_P18450 [Lodderomyces beijingensis]|uniref:Nucleotide exchange factor SIL1 n=1 Tax=Lodderomyces beijingensis TaxID=1775926 RepID=A0ABP0ZL57_9ASCO
MKATSLLAIISVITSLGHASSISSSKNIICNPEDASDCYPKLFEPSEQWQTIRPGQEIPPGLHVRLNVDTLTKEAKLMAPEDKDKDEHVNELVVGEGGVIDHDHDDDKEVDKSKSSSVSPQQKLRGEQIQQILKNKVGYKPKTRVNTQDLTNFQGAMGEIGQYDISGATSEDDRRLDLALETLEEYVHDIELGAKLTHNTDVLSKLVYLAQHGGNEQLSGKIYNIIASALRNNPDAVDNVVDGGFDYVSFTKDLFDQLGSTGNDAIQKRILGIIQALAQNAKFVQRFFTFGTGEDGLDYIVLHFNQLGPQAKQRAANILQDLQVFGKSNDRRSVEDTDPNSNVSRFIQQTLAENKLSDPAEFKKYFQNLVNLHQSDSELKPMREFLSWLSEEVESRKEKRKRDNVPVEEKEFDEAMMRARHEVFGNPMGLRKAIADEL